VEAKPQASTHFYASVPKCGYILEPKWNKKTLKNTNNSNLMIISVFKWTLKFVHWL